MCCLEEFKMRMISSIVEFIADPKGTLEAWKKYGFLARRRGEAKDESFFREEGYTHRCRCSMCGGIAFYIRPKFSSDPNNAIYRAGTGKLRPAMTALRCWPDGWEPPHKSVECFSCNHYIDYIHGTSLVICEPLDSVEESNEPTTQTG